ncbi:MAG: hypothetical protein MUC62_06610 [Candidatus Thermoplasmatota archaeon]|nr:hypothetical protein [Candidatus Thermoplasmatota archaeon]
MSSRASEVRTVLLLLFALLLAASALQMTAHGDRVSGLEFENDIYFVSSKSTEGGWVELEVTLRTGISRNVIVEIVSELDPEEGWSLTAPPPIYLQPMDEVVFEVKVTAPPGQAAGTRCRVTITAVKEDGGDLGSDACIVEVLPTTDFVISPTEEVLIDQPLEGELELSLSNTGNIPLTFTITSSEDLLSGASTSLLASGETAALLLGYSFPTDIDRSFILLIISPAGSLNTLAVQMVREGDRLHIFYGRQPRLFLYPSVPPEDGSVTALVLGGEVNNLGIETFGNDNGTEIVSNVIKSASELDRPTFTLKARGFTGKRTISVRAFGFVDGHRTTSNGVPIRIVGERAEKGLPVSAPAVIGGMTGGISLLAGSAAYLYSASETFRWRWLLLTLVPLYSLIKDDKVLDHFFRGRLYEFIKVNPGITYTALKDHFDVNNGTLTYHLLKLEREGLLVHRNMGRYKLFYAEGVRIRGCEIVVSELDIEMLSIIGRMPGINAPDLFSSVSTTRSKRTMSRHLKQLQRKGLVDVRSTGPERQLFVRSGEHSYLNPTRGVVELSDLAHHSTG